MKPLRSNYAKWDAWRRDQVTSIVRSSSKAAEEASPGILISCTIVPSIDRTYLETFQNWTLWLKQRLADNIILMNYTDDTDYMEMRSESMALPGVQDKIMTGVGAYLLKKDLPLLKEQIIRLKDSSPGIVLFSYDEVASDKDLQDFLRKNFFTRSS